MLLIIDLFLLSMPGFNFLLQLLYHQLNLIVKVYLLESATYFSLFYNTYRILEVFFLSNHFCQFFGHVT